MNHILLKNYIYRQNNRRKYTLLSLDSGIRNDLKNIYFCMFWKIVYKYSYNHSLTTSHLHTLPSMPFCYITSHFPSLNKSLLPHSLNLSWPCNLLWIEGIMDWTFTSPANSYVVTLSPNVMVFGGGDSGR